MNLDFFHRRKPNLSSAFTRVVHKATPATREDRASGHGHNNSKESLRGRSGGWACWRATGGGAEGEWLLDAVIVSAADAAADISRDRLLRGC